MSPLASALFDALATIAKNPPERVAGSKKKTLSHVRVELPRLVGRLTGSASGPEIDDALADLVSERLATRWKDGNGLDLVTLDVMGSARLGLKLNNSSTQWKRIGAKEESERCKDKIRKDGSVTVTSTDFFADEGWDPVAQLADKAAETNVEFESSGSKRPGPKPGDVKALIEEREWGIVRPVAPMVGDKPWPLPEQSTAPLGPASLGTTGETLIGLTRPSRAGSSGRAQCAGASRSGH